MSDNTVTTALLNDIKAFALSEEEAYAKWKLSMGLDKVERARKELDKAQLTLECFEEKRNLQFQEEMATLRLNRAKESLKRQAQLRASTLKMHKENGFCTWEYLKNDPKKQIRKGDFCIEPMKKQGYCLAHYKRWRKQQSKLEDFEEDNPVKQKCETDQGARSESEMDLDVDS